MDKKQFKPEAYITKSNCSGLEIMIAPSGDGLYYRFVTDTKSIETAEIFEAEIEYDHSEECIAFFMHGEVRYELSNCLKIVETIC